MINLRSIAITLIKDLQTNKYCMYKKIMLSLQNRAKFLH